METKPNTLFKDIAQELDQWGRNLPPLVYDNVTRHVANDLLKMHPELGGDASDPRLRQIAAIVGRYLVAHEHWHHPPEFR
jgi:hypothetical protein